MLRLPNDAQPVRLRADGLTRSQTLTAGGWLRPLAFACGYVQIRGDAESGVRLERDRRGGYSVAGDGRWIRGEGASRHATLGAARAAFAAFDHVAVSASIARAADAPLAPLHPIHWAIIDGPLEDSPVVWSGADRTQADKVCARLNLINARSRGAFGAGRYSVEPVW